MAIHLRYTLQKYTGGWDMKTDHDILWQEFAKRVQLTDVMLEQFKQYYKLLFEANEEFNLTTITDLRSVIAYHFEDSLALNDFIPLKDISAIADVGSGAGFPGIPLKIRFPHLSVTLIEVSTKKINFLYEVFGVLGLSNIEVNNFDWRTFLRKTSEPIELFCARASLHPDELLRMFRSSSPYNAKKLVYWASDQWVPQEDEVPFITGEYPYKIRNKRRKLVLFEQKKQGISHKELNV